MTIKMILWPLIVIALLALAWCAYKFAKWVSANTIADEEPYDQSHQTQVDENRFDGDLTDERERKQ